MFFSYSQKEQKESWLWKTPTSSEVRGWRLLSLNPTSIHSNSVFQIHREWRRLSKAGAVNFMYRLWNCHRGHVLCSVLLQKQVRPFLWWLKVTSKRKLFSFIVSISSPSRGVLCTLVQHVNRELEYSMDHSECRWSCGGGRAFSDTLWEVSDTQWLHNLITCLHKGSAGSMKRLTLLSRRKSVDCLLWT